MKTSLPSKKYATQQIFAKLSTIAQYSALKLFSFLNYQATNLFDKYHKLQAFIPSQRPLESWRQMQLCCSPTIVHLSSSQLWQVGFY